MDKDGVHICNGISSSNKKEILRLGHGNTAEAQPRAGRPKPCVYQSPTSTLPPDEPLWSSNQTQKKGGSLAWGPPTPDPMSARDMPGITLSRAGGKPGPGSPQASPGRQPESSQESPPHPPPMSAKAKWGLTKVLQSQKNPMQSWPRVGRRWWGVPPTSAAAGPRIPRALP